MNCKKCGTENAEESQFCSKCGNNLNAKKKNAKNIFALLSLLCLIIALFASNTMTNLVLLIMAFVFSIIGITKSKKIKEETGKRKGITVSIIVLIISVIAVSLVLLVSVLFSSLNMNTEFVSNQVEEWAMEKVQEEMKEQLKNPNSLIINNVKKSYLAKDQNGKFSTYYNQEELKNAFDNGYDNTVYIICYEIDYSAQNGFGGMNRDMANASITLYNGENGITCSEARVTFTE